MLLVLSTSSLISKNSQASENSDVPFVIIDFGDFSGYNEETYLVVKTEIEWADMWERHIAPYLPEKPLPQIDFSEQMVICAFMGRCPTTGYHIFVRRIFVEEGKMYVEVTKNCPPENLVVSQVITYPYVFVSLERTELEVIFNVTESDGSITEFLLPEFPIMSLGLIVFMALSAALIVLKLKVRKL